MEKELPGPMSERERAMAKAFSMCVLFRPEHYGKIVTILNSKEDMSGNDFAESLRVELAAAGLDVAEQDWAINYLKNYNKDLAAASDKKWPVHPDAREFHW